MAKRKEVVKEPKKSKTDKPGVSTFITPDVIKHMAETTKSTIFDIINALRKK